MKINGVKYAAIDIKTAERSPKEIYIKINEYKDGVNVCFSKQLMQSMDGKEYVEIYQAEDMSSFLLVRVDKATDRTIYLKRSRIAIHRKTKELTRLFHLYQKWTGNSVFVGELVDEGILFRLEKKK